MRAKRQRVEKPSSDAVVTTAGSRPAATVKANATTKATAKAKAIATATATAVEEDDAPDYAAKEYWEKRYQDGTQHHWYYTFEQLKPLFESTLPLHLLRKPSAAGINTEFTGNLLEIGCGDKPIAAAFQKEFAFKRAVAIDFSESIINQLNAEVATTAATEKKSKAKRSTTTTANSNSNNNSNNCEQLATEYVVADAREMTATAAAAFDVVVDKGTIDAMLSTDSDSERESSCSRIFSEVFRVMRPTAAFYLISHVQSDSEQWEYLLEELLLPAMKQHWNRQWSIEVHTGNGNFSDDISSNISSNNNSSSDKCTGNFCLPVGSNVVLASAAIVGDTNASIYLIRCEPRRFTRSLLNQELLPVTFKVLEYGSDSDEEDTM